jgi:hypothetical protein
LLWRVAKRLLVREAMVRGSSERIACLVNDSANLPDIGRRVERIVRRTGTVDIYFDDGSFVTSSVGDPQPTTSEEAAVIERVYGTPTKAKSCGCKHAHCKHAQQTVDMVAAVTDGEMLRAMDVGRRGSESPQMWQYLVEGPFDLYHLQEVPLGLATLFADLGTRGTRLRDGHQAWVLARKHAEPRPFRRVLA